MLRFYFIMNNSLSIIYFKVTFLDLKKKNYI